MVAKLEGGIRCEADSAVRCLTKNDLVWMYQFQINYSALFVDYGLHSFSFFSYSKITM